MRVVCATAAVLVASLAGPATAQPEKPPETAAGLVAEGERLAREGRIAESLPMFRRAAEREPSGKHECLVALTYFRLERHPEAWLHIERARALGKRPSWCGDEVLVRDVERALDKGGFAPVEIDAKPSGAQLTVSSFAPEEKLRAPVRVWLPWGRQRVRVEHEGYRPREVEAVVEGKQTIQLDVVLEPVEAVAGPEEVEPGIASNTARDDRRATAGGRSRWPWGLVVVGAAALVGGAGFHLAAASSRDAAAEMYDGPAYEAEIDRFRIRRTAAIGLYAAGALVTATGVVLLMRRGGERKPGGAGIALVPTQGGVALWLRVER